MGKQRSQAKLFIAVFVALAVLVMLQNLFRQKVVLLEVPDNSGVSLLETVNNALISVFQDGKVASWNWSEEPQKINDLKLISDQMIVLGSNHLAAVNKSGKKILTVYDFPNGQKQKEFSVGWEDQDVRLRISPGKSVIVLIRKNVPNNKASVMYEFITIHPENDLIGSPVTLSIQQDTEEFVDYACDDSSILYAVGSQEDLGRIIAVDLDKWTVLWDSVIENTKEFCSVLASPDGSILYAGNRNGLLYKLDAQSGEIIRKIELLENGETRPVTNDYSVLNLAFSPDGQYFVATINPKVYILQSDSDEIVHTFSPADRLVSKIAFSPDNKFIATSDIRAGWPIKIWPMPQDK